MKTAPDVCDVTDVRTRMDGQIALIRYSDDEIYRLERIKDPDSCGSCEAVNTMHRLLHEDVQSMPCPYIFFILPEVFYTDRQEVDQLP